MSNNLRPICRGYTATKGDLEALAIFIRNSMQMALNTGTIESHVAKTHIQQEHATFQAYLYESTNKF